MLLFKDIPCQRGSGKMQRGYYRKTRNGVTYPQHRLAYMDKYGPISSDLVIHHECHNKWCVNPEHLTSMTRSQHQEVHAGVNSKNYYDKLITCSLGHPLDGQNKKQRFCLTCKRGAAARYRAKPSTKQMMREYYFSHKEVINA